MKDKCRNNLKDPSWLRKKYREEGLSQRQIAKLCGCSQATIWKKMKKYSIESRNYTVKKINFNSDTLYALGAILSDGYSFYRKNQGGYLNGLKVKDAKFRDEFANCLSSLELSVNRYTRDENSVTYYVAEAYSKGLHIWVKKLKKYEDVFSSKSQIESFLRGYYDGDGTLNHNGNENYSVYIISTDRKRAEWILNLFKRIDFTAYFYETKLENSWRGIEKNYRVGIHKREEIAEFMKHIGSSILRKKVRV